MIFEMYIYILIPAVAYLGATVLKACIYLIKGQFSISRTLGTGGMPSGHSALVSSLATAIGISEWVDSPLFAMCLIFSAIVIYDAMNIRFQSGLHAKAINTFTKRQEKFNESLGHLPTEALAGSMLGILVAVILMQM